ncbi:MAG: VOC family protein [Chromatiales bacterium]|nr:MAG: VOC family protein [Chromatiales bacterium]
MNNIVKRTTLIVRDMDIALRWYREVLGLSIYYDKNFTLAGNALAAGKTGDITRLVILKCEHPEIGMIGLLQWLDPPLPAPATVPTGVTYGNPVFIVSTDDAAEAHRRAVALGTRVHAAPHESSVTGADGSTMHFLGTSLFDPDGYFYEFNQLLRVE